MKKSFALILFYVIAIVFLILGVSYLGIVGKTSFSARREEGALSAFYLAEAGLDYGVYLIKEGSISLPYSSTDNTLQGSKGSFDVNITEVSSERIKITATGKYPVNIFGSTYQAHQTLFLYLRPDVYSRYAYFTDDEHMRYYGWRIPVWFVTGDNIEGPTFTNSHYHIYGDPVFDGEVKSHADFIVYYHGGPPQDNPQFNQGLVLGAGELPLPSKAVDLRTSAVQGGYHWEGPTKIVFQSDGTMLVTNSQQGWVNEEVPLPDNGAIFITGGDVYVEGTLSGQVSIGTNRNVVITGNILYNDDPRLNPESQDMLALIGERDVIVDRDAPYDLEIDASIMALGDSFLVENWYASPPKGTLTVYGGIIQKERGPVGTFSGGSGEKLSGYTKDYHYDPRLENQYPPYFPRTGDWIFLSWKEG